MAIRTGWLSFGLGLLVAAAAAADDAPEVGDVPVSTQSQIAYEDRISELERKVDVLAGELERERLEDAVPEGDLESTWGLGPAASKVYSLGKGLSIGGYGEGYYRALVGDKGDASNTTDLLRAVLYFGYKFTDRIVFNSEIEVEHIDEIALEFATIDFLWHDWANLKIGNMLLPVGFLNQIHEPPFFFGVNRPDVERMIIPTTWHENGVGVFGSFDELLHYKLYVVNGMDATGFSPAGLRDGRQDGGEALAEDGAVVARLDATPITGLLVGGSVYAGNSGQNQEIDDESIPDTFTTLFDLHGQYEWRNLWLRGLWTMAFLSSADRLTEKLQAIGNLDPDEAIAETMMGGYAEIAYDIWGLLSESERSLEPFYRFEWYDTQANMPNGFGFARDRSREVWSHTVGFSFEPIPNIVLKLDYRNRNPEQGEIADEVNVGFGYVF
jgi:hypothetical protein